MGKSQSKLVVTSTMPGKENGTVADGKYTQKCNSSLALDTAILPLDNVKENECLKMNGEDNSGENDVIPVSDPPQEVGNPSPEKAGTEENVEETVKNCGADKAVENASECEQKSTSEKKPKKKSKSFLGFATLERRRKKECGKNKDHLETPEKPNQKEEVEKCSPKSDCEGSSLPIKDKKSKKSPFRAFSFLSPKSKKEKKSKKEETVPEKSPKAGDVSEFAKNLVNGVIQEAIAQIADDEKIKDEPIPVLNLATTISLETEIPEETEGSEIAENSTVVEELNNPEKGAGDSLTSQKNVHTEAITTEVTDVITKNESTEETVEITSETTHTIVETSKTTVISTVEKTSTYECIEKNELEELKDLTDEQGKESHIKEEINENEVVNTDQLSTVDVDFVWEWGGNQVSVHGSFNDWQEVPLSKSGDVFKVTISLKPGEYSYKYVVDGEWLTNKSQNILNNESGSNNVMTI